MVQDASVCQELLNAGSGEVGVASQLCDSSPSLSPSLEQLERQVSQADSPEDVETAVEQLYQAVPRQHHLQHASRVSMGQHYLEMST